MQTRPTLTIVYWPTWRSLSLVARLVSGAPVCVTVFFCLHSESNFNTWQDLPQSTAILSILLFMSYSCRGLQLCCWQGGECLALVWVIRATNSTEREAQHKSLCVCVCVRISHMLLYVNALCLCASASSQSLTVQRCAHYSTAGT